MSAAELRLFISSTFQDLHEEREHLVKKIFPEIRALCRERGITFTEVDLRWGLTDEDVVNGQVIRTCLEEIDRCRPYFIGITGERYGYVPELQEYYRDPDLLERWPWLEAAALDGASLIDLEFRHAALNDSTAATAARFFFRRQRASIDERIEPGADRSLLDDLKQRVRSGGLYVDEFRDPVSLGEMVYDELVAIIRRDFADARPPTPLEKERTRHAAFGASRRRGYIPQPEQINRLNAWLADSASAPLILYAESGSGKSSLLAFWCEQLRRRRSDLAIIEHYVGIGAGDSDHLGIIRHVMQEIKERFGRTEEIPTRPEELERGFASWLGFGGGSEVLLVIDGINQLQGRALAMRWMPPVMPAGVRLLISSTVEGTLVELRGRGWGEFGMQPLSERDREAVIVRFLAEYHKALPPEHVRRVAADSKSAHPLFLRTLLEELRLHGAHEQLDHTLEYLLETTGTEDLFQRVLERLEDDFGARTVRDVMTLLWCSRRGLTEEEIATITGIGRLKLSTLMLGLDYHLVRREGTYSFFHDYLRRAVEKKYLGREAAVRMVYGQIAAYFERAEITFRGTMELYHALEQLGEKDRLADALANIERFALACELERCEVLHLLSNFPVSRIVDAFNAALALWSSTNPPLERQQRLHFHVAELFENFGASREVIRIAHAGVALARRNADERLESQFQTLIGREHRRLGESDEAEQHIARAVELARAAAPASPSLAFALSELGSIAEVHGRADMAIECFREIEEVARSAGSDYYVAVAHSYMASAYRRQGNLRMALTCNTTAERLMRASDHTYDVGIALLGGSDIRLCLGDYDRAAECLEEAGSIFSNLGNRTMLSRVYGNLGSLAFYRGDLDGALGHWKLQEEIARELDDQVGLGNAVGNQAAVHSARGDYEMALALSCEHERIAMRMNNVEGVTTARMNQADALKDMGRLEPAEQLYSEQVDVTEEHHMLQYLAKSLGERGLIREKLGRYREAIEDLTRARVLVEQVGNDPRDVPGYEVTIAEILLRAIEFDDDMPQYLESVLEGDGHSDWRSAAVAYARERLNQAIDLATSSRLEVVKERAHEGLARLETLERSERRSVKSEM